MAGNLTIQLVDPWFEASLQRLNVTVECFWRFSEFWTDPVDGFEDFGVLFIEICPVENSFMMKYAIS